MAVMPNPMVAAQHIEGEAARAAFDAGEAAVLLAKVAADVEPVTSLVGTLYASKSGWILLSVPNALGKGAFGALDEAGAELPVSETTGQYNAHISVMRPEEIEKAGGIDAISERGKPFHYSIVGTGTVTPDTWDGVSRVWFLKVRSPELMELRRSYGLTSLPNEGKYDFHVTFAIRRKNVLRSNDVKKAAGLLEDRLQRDIASCPKCPKCAGDANHVRARGGNASCRSCSHIFTDPDYGKTAGDVPPEECCPHCDARLERGDDGNCNRCGKPWPRPKLKAAESEAKNLARFFHNAYERLAPDFGYETRKDTRELDFDSPNGQLMEAVAEEVLYRWRRTKKAEDPAIHVYAREGELFIEVMDWATREEVAEVREAAYAAVGKDNVQFGDEYGPRGPGWKKVDLPQKTAGLSASFKVREEFDPICPHCGEAMGEKACVPNYNHKTRTLESGYRHRGPCYDKGPFEVIWPNRDDPELVSKMFG